MKTNTWLNIMIITLAVTIVFGTAGVVLGYSPSWPLGECRHYQAFNEDGVMYGEWFLEGDYEVDWCDGKK